MTGVPVMGGVQNAISVNTTHPTYLVPFDRPWLRSRISDADMTMTHMWYQPFEDIMIDRSLLVADRIKRNVPHDLAWRNMIRAPGGLT
jgi:hypothetical protein